MNLLPREGLAQTSVKEISLAALSFSSSGGVLVREASSSSGTIVSVPRSSSSSSAAWPSSGSAVALCVKFRSASPRRSHSSWADMLGKTARVMAAILRNRTMCTSCLQRRAHNALCSGFLKFAAIVRDFPLEGCLCGVPSRWARPRKREGRAASRNSSGCEQVSQSRSGGDESSCLNGNLQICKLDICQEGTNASAMTSCDFQLAASVAGLQFRPKNAPPTRQVPTLPLSLSPLPRHPLPFSHHHHPTFTRNNPYTHAPPHPPPRKNAQMQ